MVVGCSFECFVLSVFLESSYLGAPGLAFLLGWGLAFVSVVLWGCVFLYGGWGFIGECV